MTYPEKPVAWLGFTDPSGFRLKKRIGTPDALEHVAKPTSAPELVTTESAKSAKSTLHPPTTVCGGLKGRTAAPTGVTVENRTAVNATTATRTDRRSIGLPPPIGGPAAALMRPPRRPAGQTREYAFDARHVVVQRRDCRSRHRGGCSPDRRGQRPAPGSHHSLVARALAYFGFLGAERASSRRR